MLSSTSAEIVKPYFLMQRSMMSPSCFLPTWKPISGSLLAPLLRRLGVPEETALLMLLRPLSGSGALAASSELIARYGADSLIGRCAAVMIGSSETTFYVIAVYSSAAGLRETRWTVPAALFADLVCFLSSAWLCRLFWA